MHIIAIQTPHYFETFVRQWTCHILMRVVLEYGVIGRDEVRVESLESDEMRDGVRVAVEDGLE